MRLDLEDIQGIVLFAYAALREALYLHVSFPAESGPGAWLARVAPEVSASTREERSGDHRVNVAFTARGLARLGLSKEELATFPRELGQGMGHALRAHVLGDVGDNAPSSWEFGGPSHEELHGLVMLFAKDARALGELRARHVGLLEEIGARIVHEDRGYVDAREPFGFADGIEQPHVAGSPRPREAHAAEVPAGEFVLGMRNAYGELPPAPVGRGGFDLGANGSYLVYRKLSQDVAGFWRTMLERARPAGDPRAAVALAARIVGRWPSGAPLVHYPDGDVGDAAFRRDFGFFDEDREGLRCPLGAHVRRANPRDALAPSPDASKKAVARHRLLRRGRRYGPPTPASVTDRAEPDGEERGLLFIAINASIRRQFEFVQQTWINSTKFAGLYDERDPLVATVHDGAASFSVQGDPVRRRLVGLPRFVTMRGGAYYFVPGRRALAWLAAARPISV